MGYRQSLTEHPGDAQKLPPGTVNYNEDIADEQHFGGEALPDLHEGDVPADEGDAGEPAKKGRGK